MKVVYWGGTLPSVLDLVARESARGPRRIQFSLQIDPGAKAVDYASAYFDEVVRLLVADVEALQRLVGAQKQRPWLILDAWGLAFHPELANFLQGLPAVLRESERALILMPRPFPGQWRHVQAFAKSAHPLQAFVAETMVRIEKIHEVIWNADADVSCLEFAPQFEMLEALCGRTGLAPQKRFGVHFLPGECRNHEAAFVGTTSVVKHVLRFLGVISDDAGVPGWWTAVQPEILYRSGEVLALAGAGPEGGGPDVPPAPSGHHPTGSAGSTGAASAARPWPLLSETWQVYARDVSASAIALLKFFNAGRQEPRPPADYAQLFYLLGILEREMRAGKTQKAFPAQELFGTSSM